MDPALCCGLYAGPPDNVSQKPIDEKKNKAGGAHVRREKDHSR